MWLMFFSMWTKYFYSELYFFCSELHYSDPPMRGQVRSFSLWNGGVLNYTQTDCEKYLRADSETDTDTEL